MKKNNIRKQHVDDFRAVQKIDVSRWQGLSFPSIWLILAWMALIVIGMIMVTSASISEAKFIHDDSFYFARRQAVFYIGALIIGYIVYSLGTSFFYENANLILLISFILMLIIYIPGVGYTANGARRWLNLRVVYLQVGEILKFTLIIFSAAYLRRMDKYLEYSSKPMLIMLLVIGVFAGLLLLQPDFGTTVVLVTTLLGMMFLAGVSLWRFAIIAGLGVVSLLVVLILEPYRVQRLLTYTDPWKHQYDEGYQLVNSLISFGNGGLFGVGLGEGVQKQQFLPEAHTDFVFSVIAEELGLLGSLGVIALFCILVWQAFSIGLLAEKVRNLFSRNVAYGIGLLIAIQTIINIGVTSGALPTKGLTLPLISYGGSSVVITCVCLAFLARIDSESRFQAKREGKI